MNKKKDTAVAMQEVERGTMKEEGYYFNNTTNNI